MTLRDHEALMALFRAAAREGMRLGLDSMDWARAAQLAWHDVVDEEAYLDNLADRLRVDRNMLDAIADGGVPVDAIAIRHPVGGIMVVNTLNEYDAVVNEVEEAGGPEAWDRQRLPPPGPRRRFQRPQRPYVLYRLWTDDDRLLYVGITSNLEARLKAHRKTWGAVVHHHTAEPHPDAQSALAAEADAIRDELPRFNIAGV